MGFKLQMNLAPEAGVSQGMVDVDLKVNSHLICLTAQGADSALGIVHCAGLDILVPLQTTGKSGSIKPEQMGLPVCDLSSADADSAV